MNKLQIRKINEENLTYVRPKIKRVPAIKKKFQFTVGDLKKIIKDLDDNTPIVLPCEEHEYKYANAKVTTALFTNSSIFEDYGIHEDGFGDKHTVLIIE